MKDDVVLLMLNFEGDSEELEKTSRFCQAVSCEAQDHVNYIHVAFVGDRDARGPAFEQFKLEYIPHYALLSSKGVFLGNKMQGEDMETAALRAIGKSTSK